MTHPRRGKLIIISNRYFLPTSPVYKWPNHGARDGTEFDSENLRLTFNQLGFDCEVHEDKTCAEMLGIFMNGMRLFLSVPMFCIISEQMTFACET